MRAAIAKYLPILEWGRTYRTETFVNDAVAAVVVTIMLIPQSLAYAMLAGLPPQVGLYASIAPLIVYALFGASRTLAVGPVAILSLMTAAAAGKIAAAGSPQYIEAAIVLALLAGGILMVMGLFRMGFLANFLSHPVISGFITASGVLIAASQLKHLLGLEARGHTLVEIVASLLTHLPRDQPGDVRDRRRGSGVPVLDAQQPKAASDRSGSGRKDRDHHCARRPGVCCRCEHSDRGRIRPARRWREDSWARCRVLCRRSACRGSIKRSGCSSPVPQP